MRYLPKIKALPGQTDFDNMTKTLKSLDTK